MIVCVCRAVSDGEVKQSIRHGAASVSEIGEACGAGTDCGSCCDMLCTMLQDARGRDAAHDRSQLLQIGLGTPRT